MNQDKEEYEVGIPLNDLTGEETLPADDMEQEDAAPLPEDDEPDEGAGLPSLFDEDELAEVGLKASPFKEGDESEATDDIDEEGRDDEPVSPQSEDDAGAADDDLPATADESDDLSLETDDLSEEEDTIPDYPKAEKPLDEVLGEDALKLDDQPVASLSEEVDYQLQFDAIKAQLAALQNEFAGKLKYDAHKDEIIDKLHQELQEYKQDIVKKHILSIVLDVVKVADDIRKWITYFRSLDVSQRDPVKLFRYLEAIPSDLEDIFYWQGVKPYTNKEGLFDPARQRTIKKVFTGDISKDKTIAKSLRPGYEWEGKVIRQEMVAVYVYTEEKESVDTGKIDE
jgi:molecular chaperone GrpE (heat shock protein)